MLQHHIIQFLLYYLSSGHLQEDKKKRRKFETFSSKSACGCLQEVVAYNRFHSDLTGKFFNIISILENWLLRRGGV